MHRIVWSVMVLCLLLVARRKFSQVLIAIRNPKIITTLSISGLLLALNWLIFIWAVNNDRMLDASLGYFINPLFNVLLARLFLQESLTRLQLLAVFVALSGVAFFIF
jgi:chloramphenicol-sensitive protein RarD